MEGELRDEEVEAVVGIGGGGDGWEELAVEEEEEEEEQAFLKACHSLMHFDRSPSCCSKQARKAAESHTLASPILLQLSYLPMIGQMLCLIGWREKFVHRSMTFQTFEIRGGLSPLF